MTSLFFSRTAFYLMPQVKKIPATTMAAARENTPGILLEYA
ncbi:hypothetical protein VDGL01_01182 [Verticillium dahliae]